MARRKFTLLPPHIEIAVQERAVKNMRLAFRRAIKRNAMPKWAEMPKHKRIFLRIYRKAAIKNRFAAAYGRSGDLYHVDHIVSLAGENVCGLMVPWNLHVILAVVNMAKSTLIVEEWHSKMPDDGKKQLRAAQEQNRRKREDYLRRKGQRGKRSPVFDVLFK